MFFDKNLFFFYSIKIFKIKFDVYLKICEIFEKKNKKGDFSLEIVFIMMAISIGFKQ